MRRPQRPSVQVVLSRPIGASDGYDPAMVATDVAATLTTASPAHDLAADRGRAPWYRHKHPSRPPTCSPHSAAPCSLPNIATVTLTSAPSTYSQTPCSSPRPRRITPKHETVRQRCNTSDLL